MKENKHDLLSFFLNHSKDKALKRDPRLAWAHHVHGLMVGYFEEVLETQTFCEHTQMRNWKRANQLALCALEDKPLPFSLKAKDLCVQEILALREDLETLDEAFENLPALKYLGLSQVYFEYFRYEGLNKEPLSQIDMLAEQAVILVHPHIMPADTHAYKLYFAHLFLKQLAWDYPLTTSEELPALAKKSLNLSVTEERVRAQIAYTQDRARAKLRTFPPKDEPEPSSQRTITSQKISELQALFSFPREDSWSRLNIELDRSEFSLNEIQY